jgi:hypothetical protein
LKDPGNESIYPGNDLTGGPLIGIALSCDDAVKKSFGIAIREDDFSVLFRIVQCRMNNHGEGVRDERSRWEKGTQYGCKKNN